MNEIYDQEKKTTETAETKELELEINKRRNILGLSELKWDNCTETTATEKKLELLLFCKKFNRQRDILGLPRLKWEN